MKALVIGGGIGGLSAAIALRIAGVHVEVFERAPGPREVGAGISLWANAIHAMEQLGLGAVVRGAGAPYVMDGLRSVNGRMLSRVPVRELEQRLGVLVVMMHRADLLAALIEALGASHIRYDAQCTGFTQDSTGVTATFANGSTATGHVLIGADGLHSVVRTGLHGDIAPRYSGATAWRAIVHGEARSIRSAETWGKGQLFGQVPVDDHRIYWYASVHSPPGLHAHNEKDELKRLYAGWPDPIGQLIEATNVEDILRNDISDRPPLAHWGRDRVTLLGDAAHPMTPHLGQGGCQALEDAVVLGQCFRNMSSATTALRAYEKLRTPRANSFVQRSRGVGKLAMLRNPLATAVRDTLIRLMGPRGQVRQMVNMVGFKV